MSRSDPHLVPLRDGWSMWRCVWLRSAGFSSEHLTQLGAPEAARAIERLVAIQGDPSRRSEVDSALSAARETYDREGVRIGQVLRAAARDPKFREAMFWQNRRMMHGSIDAFVRSPVGATNSKAREHERLMASYVQRYVAKNETIGFFGPVAWAGVDLREQHNKLVPGIRLLSQRNVRFERWAIAEVASAIATDLEIRRQIAPRLAPSFRLTDTTLIQTNGTTVSLPEEMAELIARCDGRMSADRIASDLVEEAVFSTPAEAFEALQAAADQGIILWSFDIPVWDAAPERALAAAIDGLEPGLARDRAQSLLEDLESSRARIAAAAGETERLDEALAAADATFERVSGRSAARREGQAYAGRTIVYEDCVRDVSCTVGASFVEALAAPLALVLNSARWFTHKIGKRFEEILRRELAGLDDGSGSVNYLELWSRIDGYLYGEGAADVGSIAAEATTRWAQILGIRSDVRRIQRSAAELEPAVRAAFEARGPGWPQARLHSPDVLIAAANREAFERGELLIVLGELHTSVASMLSLVGLAQHPSPEDLFQWAAADIPQRLLTTVESEQFSTRADYVPPKPRDPQLELTSSRSSLPRDRVVIARDARVVIENGRPVIKAGDWSFDALECFGQYLSFSAISRLSVVDLEGHTPRVTIDRVVVARERWRFAPADLPWLKIEDRFERFARALTWSRDLGLPRYVFAKLPEEPKPFCVDFESPVLMEIFARRANKSQNISLTEMLPSLDDLWLVDAEGRRYTSEMRMVAVDPISWEK